MPPTASNFSDSVQIPSMRVVPTVGLRAKRAALVAGDTREPKVSDPIDIGLYPADTPTAEPEEDPHVP